MSIYIKIFVKVEMEDVLKFSLGRSGTPNLNPIAATTISLIKKVVTKLTSAVTR